MAEPSPLLASIHATERALEALQRRQASLPGEIEAQEAKAQAARDVVTEQKSTLAEAEKRRRDKEAELQDTEAQRDKFQGQTAQVKTNEEYTALLREIEHAGERISSIEEEILGAMEAVEEVSARLATVEGEQKKQAEDHDRQAEERRAELAQVEKEQVERASQLTSQVSELEPRLKASFERTRKGRGTGTSMIEGAVCSGCHRDVPFEDVNRVTGGELLPCTHCGRLLVPSPPEEE